MKGNLEQVTLVYNQSTQEANNTSEILLIAGAIIVLGFLLVYKVLIKKSHTRKTSNVQQKTTENKLRYSKRVNYNVLKMIDILAEIYKKID